MKNNTASSQKNLLTRLLIIISLMSFNCVAFAEEHYVSEVKITKDMKVPKVTHTHHADVRVTTSVKVEGADEKTNNQVKNSVVKVVKQALAQWEKTAGYQVVKSAHKKKKYYKHHAKKALKKAAKAKAKKFKKQPPALNP